MPLMSSRVVMKVIDKDLVADEMVGSILFDLKDYINPNDSKSYNGMFRWVNIYGAPLN